MAWTIAIEVTRACNFTCTHCMVDAGRPRRGEMDTQELKRVISELAPFDVGMLAWSGGEPLIRRDLEELTAHVKSLRVPVSVASNGFLATRDRLASLRDSGLDAIQVSLDGPDEARAGRFRKGPRASFERAVQSVRTSVELGLDTVVCCLLTPDTAGEIDEMLPFVAALGARALRYTLWAPLGKARAESYDERPWRSPAVRRFLDVAEQPRGWSDVEVILDCPTGPRPGWSSFRCVAGCESIYVLASGEVFPCTTLMTRRYLVGNVRERPLGEILRERALFNVHREMLAAMPGGACARCNILAQCLGGCPGNAFAQYGKVRGGPRQGDAPVCLRRLHDPAWDGRPKPAKLGGSTRRARRP